MKGDASESSPQRALVEEEILALMRETPWRQDDAHFDRLARDLFAFQFSKSEAYARFARSSSRTPDDVGSWREIPAVPTGAFKEVALRCFASQATCKTFRTSGTSSEKPGELHLDTLVPYETSLLVTLDRLLFPDIPPDRRRLIRVLAPTPEEAPDSSLSHMFGVLVRERGTPESGFDVHAGQLDHASLQRDLEAAARRSEPVTLCGTAFAFVHLLDELCAKGHRIACAQGSRIMETGGFKGRSRELSRSELHEALENELGVPRSRIVNQYGMTELGSQFYDSLMVNPGTPLRKLGPPWARVRLIDPESGRECREGETGMVVVHDLANTGSVAAIQTADLGRWVSSGSDEPGGFEILGRDPAAEARGCSIAADTMLAGGAI